MSVRSEGRRQQNFEDDAKCNLASLGYPPDNLADAASFAWVRMMGGNSNSAIRFLAQYLLPDASVPEGDRPLVELLAHRGFISLSEKRALESEEGAARARVAWKLSNDAVRLQLERRPRSPAFQDSTLLGLSCASFERQAADRFASADSFNDPSRACSFDSSQLV